MRMFEEPSGFCWSQWCVVYPYNLNTRDTQCNKTAPHLCKNKFTWDTVQKSNETLCANQICLMYFFWAKAAGDKKYSPKDPTSNYTE